MASKLPQVAYFCMEYALESSFKIYSGGLGILAGDYFKGVKDYGFPMVGIGTDPQQGTRSDMNWSTQDAKVLAHWRKLGTFRSDAKFSTWLFGIACNEWRMHARGRKELRAGLARLMEKEGVHDQ